MTVTSVECAKMAAESNAYLDELTDQLKTIESELDYESLKAENLKRVEEVSLYGSACTGVAIREENDALSQTWDEILTPYMYLKLQWGDDAFTFNKSWREQLEGDLEMLEQSNKSLQSDRPSAGR